MSDWTIPRYTPPEAPTATPPELGPERFNERTTPDEWASQADPGNWDQTIGRDPSQEGLEEDAPQMTRAGEKDLTPEEKIKENKKGGMVAFMCPLEVAEEIIEGVPEAVDPRDMHVTLVCFDGLPPDEESREEVIEAVRAAVEKHGPIQLKVTGIAQFDPHDGLYPTVALVSGGPALDEIRADVVSVLEERGIPIKKDFGFVPHMTIAYTTTPLVIPTDEE